MQKIGPLQQPHQGYSPLFALVHPFLGGKLETTLLGVVPLLVRKMHSTMSNVITFKVTLYITIRKSPRVSFSTFWFAAHRGGNDVWRIRNISQLKVLAL